MKIYCPDCGNRLEYAAKKPNFCVNCGYKFAGAQVEHTAPVPDEQYAEEESEPSDFDRLGGLHVDIEVPKSQGVKFGDVCGIASQENGTKAGDVYTRPSDNTPKEVILEQLRQEGSTARGGSTPPSKKV